MTPIDKVLGEGNCGEVTDRGKEACECVRQADTELVVGRIHAKAARLRTETRYKAGGDRRVSPRAPTAGWSAKPSSFIRIGKSRACAVKVVRLIQGDLSHVPVSRACPKGGAAVGDCGRVRQKSAEGIVRIRHTPLAAERPEP